MMFTSRELTTKIAYLAANVAYLTTNIASVTTIAVYPQGAIRLQSSSSVQINGSSSFLNNFAVKNAGKTRLEIAYIAGTGDMTA